MAITLHTIAGNIANLLRADLDPTSVRVVVESSVPADEVVVNETDGEILLGSALLPVGSDGTFVAENLIDFNSTDVQPTNIQYRWIITFRNAGARKVEIVTLGWYNITADGNLADLVTVAALDPTVVTDDAVATLINTLGTDTVAALEGVIDDHAPQSIEDATGRALLANWGIAANGREVRSAGGMTSGSPTLFLPVTFTSADVGKLIAVDGAGASGGTLVSTIFALGVDANHVTLADNAVTTTTTATVSYGTDDTAALQAMIDNGVRGRGQFIEIGASKAICISGQIIVPGAAKINGASAEYGNQDNSPTGGSDLWWFGASGTDAVVTSTDAEADWSRGDIRNLRITNKAKSNAAGWGLVVRNAQNAAELYNVTVIDFPDGACKVRETKSSPLGVYPGFFRMDRCFFIGGKVPLSLAQGGQQVAVTGGGCDTNAATITAGVEIIPGPIPSTGPRNPISFRDFKVEVATTTTVDVPAFKVTADVPLILDNVEAQDNRATVSTKGVVEHTNSTRKWARIIMKNVSAWYFGYSLRLLSAGFDLPNPGTSAPWATTWEWNSGDLVTWTFVHTAIATSMSSDNAGKVGAGTGSGAVTRSLAIRPGVIVGMTATLSNATTAGTLTAKIIKNGSTTVHQLQFSTAGGSTQRLSVDLMATDLDASTPADQVFAAGDAYGVNIDTSGTFAPTASQKLVVEIMARLYGKGH